MALAPERYAKPNDYSAPRGFCRYCKKPVEPPKQSWCSQECVDEYLVRRSPTDGRRAVFKRDAGVCADCGLDTVAAAKPLKINLRTVDDRATYLADPTRYRIIGGSMIDRHAVMDLCRERGRHQNWPAVEGRIERGSAKSALWDMDHIVPVKDGGGGCGLDNLQTLCLWCHDEKTHGRKPPKGQGSLLLG